MTSSSIENQIVQNNLEIMSYLYYIIHVHHSTLYKVEHHCQRNFIPEDLLNMSSLQSDLQKLSLKYKIKQPHYCYFFFNIVLNVQQYNCSMLL